MGKRLLSLLLAVVLTLSLAPAAFAADDGADEVTEAEPVSGGFDLTGDRRPIGVSAPEENVVASGGDTEGITYAEGMQMSDPGFQTKFSRDTLDEARDPSEKVTFIVMTKDKPLLARFAVEDITANTLEVRAARKIIDTNIDTVATTMSKVFAEEDKTFEMGSTFNVVTSAFTVDTEYSNKATLESLPGVEGVYVAPTFTLPEDNIEQYEFSVTGDGYTLAPLTFNSGKMIGASPVWESGYTGVGTKIAIIDSGLTDDFNHHPSFSSAPIEQNMKNGNGSSTAKTRAENYMTESELKAIYPNLHACSDANGVAYTNLMYRSAKIPFSMSYIPNPSTGKYSFDVSHEPADQGGSDHGTHVAGIAAGDVATTDKNITVSGIASDAQIIPMNVFHQGSASMETVMLAIEDAVVLGVDVMNLSLGMTAGFSDADPLMTQILAECQEAGVHVVMAAGNDGNNGEHMWNNTGHSRVENPDTGLVGAPASYSPSIAVASVNNNQNYFSYFLFDGDPVAVADGYTQAGYPVDKNYESYIDTINGISSWQWSPTSGEDMPTVEKHFVYAGLGNESDYTELEAKGISVKDAIVLVERGGTLTFQERQSIATRHGVGLLLIANNEPGFLSIVLNSNSTDTVTVLIQRDDGAKMKAAWEEAMEKWDAEADENEEGEAPQHSDEDLPTLTLVPASVYTYVDIPSEVSSFSSWGVSPNMELKPDIAGVGGNILSSVDPEFSGAGGYYATMSGTSMATPQVSGAMAIISDFVREKFPDKSAAERRDIATRLAMSYAVPTIYDTDTGLEYSPRQQGAGLINLEKIVGKNNLSYLSSESAYEGRPKGQMGDDPKKTGVMSFKFDITNTSESDLAYTFDWSVLTEGILDELSGKFLADAPYALEDADFTLYAEQKPYADFNGDGEITTMDAYLLLLNINGLYDISRTDDRWLMRDVDNSGYVDLDDVKFITDYCAEIMQEVPADGVTVPAGETLHMKAVITLTDEDKEYLDQFPNGIYVEGFLYCEPSTIGDSAEALDELSMPFIGFYGDWSAAPVFDTTSLQDAELYPTMAMTYASKIGTNPYLSGSNRNGEEYNAFSVTNPIYEIDFGTFRNIKTLAVDVTDIDTGEEYYSATFDGVTKTSYGNYGLVPNYLTPMEGSFWEGATDKRGNPLDDGTRVQVKMTAYLDDGDDVPDDTYTLNATVDNEAPVLLNEEDILADEPRPNKGWWIDDEGRLMLHLEIEENQNLAAILVARNPFNIYSSYEFDNEPGEVTVVDLDITAVAQEHFRLILADYACNEQTYILDVNLDGMTARPPILQLDKDHFYGCETYDAGILHFGWFSAPINGADRSNVMNVSNDTESRYYSAEYINGYIFAQSLTGDLIMFSPYEGVWTSEVVYDMPYSSNAEAGWFTFGDLAVDYSTDTLYANGWTYEANEFGEVESHNRLMTVTFTDEGCEVKNLDEYKMDDGTEAPNIEVMTVTTEGQMYGIDVSGKLYKIDKETSTLHLVGMTGFARESNFVGLTAVQSLFYDHNTGKCYWAAHSQFLKGTPNGLLAHIFEVNLETAETTLVGDWGPTGPTGCFIPTDKTTTLLNMGCNPTDFDVADLSLIEGSTGKLRAGWEPWTSFGGTVTYTCESDGISISGSTVTGLKAGTYTVEATAQIDDGEGGLKDCTKEVTVTVLPSTGDLYSYLCFVMPDFVFDQQFVFEWGTFTDVDPLDYEFIEGGNEVVLSDEIGQMAAQWFGGVYYNGKIYVSHIIDQIQPDLHTMLWSSGIYEINIELDDEGHIVSFGDPELIAQTELGPEGEIYGLGVDYSTGRLYYTTSIKSFGFIDLHNNTFGETMPYIGLPDYDPVRVVYGVNFTVYYDEVQNDYFGVLVDSLNRFWKVDLDTGVTVLIGQYDADFTNPGLGSLTYSYTNDCLYWAPNTDGYEFSFYAVKPTTVKTEKTEDPEDTPEEGIDESEETYEYTTTLNFVDLGGVHNYDGVCQSVVFNIPDKEPDTGYTPITSMELSAETLDGVTGGKAQLTITTEPLYNSAQAPVWTSSDEDVVTVDENGLLTFVGEGTATITATISQNYDGEVGVDYEESVTDSTEVTVYESAGHTLYTFTNNYMGGIGSDGFGHSVGSRFISFDDSGLWEAESLTPTPSSFTLRAGAYFDGLIYGYTSNSPSQFVRVDAKDPAVFDNLASNSDNVQAMAYNYGDGQMYAIAGSMSSNRTLNTVDLATGKLTKVENGPEASFLNGASITFDPEGVMYILSGQKLYKVEKTDDGKFDFEGKTEVADLTTYGNSEKGSIAYDWEHDRVYVYLNYPITGLYFVEVSDEAGADAEDGTEKANVVKLDAVRLAGDIAGELQCNFIQFIPNSDESDTVLYADEDNIPVSYLELNADSLSLAEGSEYELDMTIRPSVATDYEVDYESSDEDVATVDDGVVTAVGKGEAKITITVKQDDKEVAKKECSVKVVDAESGELMYTVEDGVLVSFYSDSPSSTTKVVDLNSDLDASTVLDISSGAGCVYVVTKGEAVSFGPVFDLYKVDVNTHEVEFLGGLKTQEQPTQDDLGGITVDEENGRVYLFAEQNFYVYSLEALDPDNPENASSAMRNYNSGGASYGTVCDGFVGSSGDLVMMLFDYANPYFSTVTNEGKFSTYLGIWDGITLGAHKSHLVKGAAMVYANDANNILYSFANEKTLIGETKHFTSSDYTVKGLIGHGHSVGIAVAVTGTKSAD